MNPRERGFLLLTSCLGNPERHPLTTAQFRTLTDRMAAMEQPGEDRELQASDLLALGYSQQMARRILGLLEEEELLDYYVSRGRRAGCTPVTRVSEGYPLILRKRLGTDSPGCLWAKGDVSLLERPAIALVGSRDLAPENRLFARKVGEQAAKQGFVLVSGNARGADKEAQNACLRNGGSVVSVVADSLQEKEEHRQILYLSEEGYDQPFSAQRAISRNRVIHALGWRTLVAQAAENTGGTWDGTVKNLRGGWSPVFCFADGSPAMALLTQMGAGSVSLEMLEDLSSLQSRELNFFDQ